MKPKPAHLGPQYAEQFCDESVARAYYARPPYPAELFDILESLIPRRPSRVLELGCGSGDLTLELARRVDHIDAVDFSKAMLGIARTRPGAEQPHIQWHHMAAESFAAEQGYNLVVAGASLHWMEWAALFPKIDSHLVGDGLLAIANRAVVPYPWEDELRRLIPQYSTNRDYEPYDLIEEIRSRGLFVEYGRRTTSPVSFKQGLDDYVESFHSSNGFSRDRMEPGSAQEFDEMVRRFASPWSVNGLLEGEVVANVVWGRVTVNN